MLLTFLLGGLRWLQGQNVVRLVVQLVGRPVTWCAGRAAYSDTVVTVRTGLNFGADLCQDHLCLTWIKTLPAARRVSQRCNCVTWADRSRSRVRGLKWHLTLGVGGAARCLRMSGSLYQVTPYDEMPLVFWVVIVCRHFIKCCDFIRLASA
jgi:hypothetical protein